MGHKVGQCNTQESFLFLHWQLERNFLFHSLVFPPIFLSYFTVKNIGFIFGFFLIFVFWRIFFLCEKNKKIKALHNEAYIVVYTWINYFLLLNCLLVTPQTVYTPVPNWFTCFIIGESFNIFIYSKKIRKKKGEPHYKNYYRAFIFAFFLLFSHFVYVVNQTSICLC